MMHHIWLVALHGHVQFFISLFSAHTQSKRDVFQHKTLALSPWASKSRGTLSTYHQTHMHVLLLRILQHGADRPKSLQRVYSIPMDQELSKVIPHRHLPKCMVKV
eukprot:1943339-Amphidinium_carterae.1